MNQNNLVAIFKEIPIIDIISWSGAIIYILAYFLLSQNILSSNKTQYHFLNALGGIGLIINGVVLNDFPNIVVNFIWLLIAMYSIRRIICKNNNN